MDPVTVTVVAVPSIAISAEASPTTHCVVKPDRVNSTVVLCVRVRSSVVPSTVSVVVVPETVTSRDVLSPVAVQVVVVPSTINVAAVAANSATVLVAPTEVVRVEPGKEVVVVDSSLA